MLWLFDQGLNTTKATKATNDTYDEVLPLRTCRFWFSKFKSGNRNLKDAPRAGRPSNFDEDMLRAVVENDPRLSIEEISQKMQSPWSTVQKHLKHIEKANRMGIWMPHELSEDNKKTKSKSNHQKRNTAKRKKNNHDDNKDIHSHCDESISGDEFDTKREQAIIEQWDRVFTSQ